MYTYSCDYFIDIQNISIFRLGQKHCGGFDRAIPCIGGSLVYRHRVISWFGKMSAVEEVKGANEE